MHLILLLAKAMVPTFTVCSEVFENSIYCGRVFSRITFILDVIKMIKPDAVIKSSPFEDTQSTGERLLTGYYDRFTIEHLHRYGLAASMAKGVDVLDIACGEGYGSNYLASVAHTVLGVDIDAGAVDHAASKYVVPNLKFVVGSADSIPLESASVDLVVSFETLEHHSRHEEMYAEIKRVLRPNGILIISTPDKYYFSDLTGHRNAYHVKELYVEEFSALNQRYFKNTEMYSQKVLLGSLILPHQSRKCSFSVLTGDHAQINTHTSISAPTYHICVASDAELIDLGYSTFDGERVFSEMEALLARYVQSISQLENNLRSLQKTTSDLKKSVSYRLGNMLLWPIKTLLRH